MMSSRASGDRRPFGSDYFGALLMIRAFAPVLGRNGGGAIVNSLSLLSLGWWR